MCIRDRYIVVYVITARLVQSITGDQKYIGVMVWKRR